MKIEITVIDLWREADGGYSANGCYVDRTIIDVKENETDLAITRKIKDAAGINGWRKDWWCSCDFGPWRDGLMGAYADIIE